MTIEVTYYPLINQTEITDAQLAYIRPLFVARSGVVHSKTDIDALLVSGSPFYQYNASTGTISFNPNIPFNTDESINVVFKTI